MKWRSLEESMSGADSRSLREIFAERKELIAKYVPPEIQAVQRRVIGELKGARLAANVPQLGSKAPAFHSKIITVNWSRRPISSSKAAL